MTPPPRPRVVRTKTTELTVVDGTRLHLVARLTDMSYDCVYDDAPTDSRSAAIHDFVVEGDLDGADLVITALGVDAVTHPYRGSPAIVPRCQALVGQSLASGWRRAVLDTLGGTVGCTHVTTLLLGLAEARTMAFFLRMNARVPYAPRTREDGRWTAAGLELAPSIVDACHVLASSGPVVARGASRLAADDPPAGPPLP